MIPATVMALTVSADRVEALSSKANKPSTAALDG